MCNMLKKYCGWQKALNENITKTVWPIKLKLIALIWTSKELFGGKQVFMSSLQTENACIAGKYRYMWWSYRILPEADSHPIRIHGKDKNTKQWSINYLIQGNAEWRARLKVEDNTTEWAVTLRIHFPQTHNNIFCGLCLLNSPNQKGSDGLSLESKEKPQLPIHSKSWKHFRQSAT